MQKGDPNDALKPCQAGGNQPASALVQGTVQHLIQLQTINSQGQEASRQGTLGVLQVSGLSTVKNAASTIPATQHAVVVTSPSLAQLFTPTSSITGSLTLGPVGVSQGTPIIPVQTNPLQRQLSDQGNLSPMKSVRNVVGHIGSVVPGHDVSMSSHGGSELHQQPLQQSHSMSASGATVHHQLSLPLTPTSSVSASGGTIHHHGQSPIRGTVIPLSNLQRISTMNQTSQVRGSSSESGGMVTGSVTPKGLLDMKVFTGVSVSPLPRSPGSAGPSPRKKLKLEEKPPATSEIEHYRKLILDHIHKEMLEIKENYIEHLSELFFLQNGGSMMDYMSWKKRPTPQLVTFLKSSNLDSDEEDIQERRISDEVRILATSGSNQPLATPVAISTTLPPSVAALSQQGSDGKKLGGRHGMVFLHAPTSQQLTHQTLPGSSSNLGLNIQTTKSTVPTHVKSVPTSASVSTPSVSHSLTTTCSSMVTSTSQLHSQLVRSSSDTKPVTVHTSRAVHTPISSPAIQHKQQSITAMYENSIFQGSQEAIVERAKQEAQVMQRVAELRKEGLWSSRKLPKVQEPQRNKAHWDYLLEEMMWLSADFMQERKWKKAAARKVAKMVQKYHQELEQKEIKAEKEEGQRLKKIAGQIAKQVKEFWTNIEKVVQFKQQTLLEEKRKKALDLHLNFIVDQTEKYSSWLTEGLAAGSTGGSSIAGSVDGASDHSGEGGDDDFCPEGSETDDEETIDIEEKDGLDEEKTQEELEALQKESELPLEDILKDLPQEMLEKPATVIKDEDLVESKETISEMEEMDKEFSALDEEDADVEDTIEEQEKIEKKEYSKEINELQEEGDMSMEDLISKYAGAYDSDFDMPESESEIDDTEDEDSDEEEDEEEEEEEDDDDDDDDEEDDDEEIEVDDKDTLDVGLEFLMKPAESSEVDQTKGIEDTKGPSKEITDIAAEALSVQPKGYTLETAEVKTTIPFLLKHILREYQHVGLDWMATMYGKKLNGILADEMGLGKTIQTIALLAHLACEKGIWGPHLIVVPTSVMLNWEMELKKWCPAFKILTYYGNHKERKLKRMGWTKTNAFHVCITSYKLVIQDHQSFRRKKWKYFILDEAQNIKNFKSQRWQTLLNFQSQRRLLLTGTPLQNSLMELWSLMHFLMPNVFQSHKEFKEWFANPLTGMIEGSHEYNENLIYRLHKVLRPFLLRRLKADVEKQMPKKYEHVIMCALSKRQRYLYDDFMSQRKTKDTLATGQFMSVINILMQLRKVCNHPSLFDARPIVSPFQTEGIVYHTSSIVLKVFEHNPLEKIDLSCWFPGLVDMERDLPAFIAHRVKKLQTQRKLIEEIDIQPDSPPRPPPGKLKPVVFRGVSPMIQSGRSSPVPQLCASRPASPMPPMRSQVGQVIAAAASQLAKKGILQSGLSVPQSTVAPQITTVTAPLQAKVLPQQGGCLHFQNRAITGLHQTTSGMQQSVTSQPITVQIQQTDQGTRLMIPTGQLSQLPAGFIQIVQTSAGQQIIATSNPSVMQPVISTQNCIFATTLQSVNSSPAITNVASSLNSVKVTSSSPPVRTTPQIQLPTTPVLTGIKPIMRVSPLVTEQKPASTTVLQVSRAEESPSTTVKLSGSEEKPFSAAAPVPSLSNVTTTAKVEDTRKKKSELYMKSLDMNRRRYRKGKLDYLARLNKIHCEMRPVYGEDLCNAVDVTSDLEKTLIKDNTWHGHGHVLCSTVHTRKHLHADATLLSELVHTPDQYLKELEDILERFVFATPTVTAPPIRMHVSHPPPSYLLEQRRNAFQYQKEFAPRSACLGSISTKMTVQFPELRLIQYDCGKLQSLDILLRRLKSGSHRVLIFTQMTKMLDIFEAFLNYHGHRYLRLDGTTKVEKRQVLMDRFNADRRIFCFILSTRSGGLGVNLTGADTVIFYDSDWNPTMDAQAQDRCHRIGQTRDVHIYRLISEKTIEENILKKANQKRLLGDLAIEGGNFTTAFFKSQTIQELFSEPSGLQSLSEEVSSKPDEKETIKEIVPQNKPKMKGSDTSIVSQFEQALGKAEDETDAIAADLVKAEQKAELAEFDESIPWDEREAELRKEEEDMTRAEQELCMLEKELSPIERYAVSFMETDIEPFEDELQVAEEDIENAKKEWELTRLKSLKEEEERRAEIEEDEMLYTYARDDSYSQVFISDDGEQMPLWAPPTPPQDDNDVYIDQSLFFLYEPQIMPETQLPPVYIRKHKKPKIESITTRKQKQRKEEQPRVPRSLFDRPNAALLKIRREAKLQKLKQGLIKPYRPVQPLLSKPAVEPTVDHPEWLIHEDWALLQAVQSLFDVPLNLMIVSPAHLPNWDLVADVVNTCSRVYRSAKQCRNRYENVIIPREEGRILYDMNPKKQKKTKGLYKVPTKSNRPMRTGQLYVQDSNGSVTLLHSLRFDSMKAIAAKRPATMRQTLINPTMKNPKHAHVLTENNITYEQPLNPLQVAENRAQRIQREKKLNQAQAAVEQQLSTQRQNQQVQGQTATVVAQPQATPTVTAVAQPQIAQIVPVVPTTVITAATVAKPVGQVGTAVPLTRAVGGTGTFVVNTASGVNTNTFAAINRRMTQATPNITPPATVTVTGTLSPALRAQRPAGTQLTIQEITAVPNQGQTVTQAQVVAQTQARPHLQTNVAAQAQLAAQRITSATTVTAATVQQQLTQVPLSKNFTPQQLQLLRNRSVQQQQQQQFRMQKLNVLPEQLRQQHIKRLTTQGQTITGQKTAVIAQQLVTGLAQAKQGQLKTTTGTRSITPEDFLRMKQQQQQQLVQKAQVQAGLQQVQVSQAQLPASQIIAQAQVQPVGNIATCQAGGTTLVKAVSTPTGGITIPVSTVNINVNVPGQKTTLAKATTVAQGHPQQLQKQMLLQHRKVPQIQQPQRLATLGQVGKTQIPNAVQIIQQPSGQRLTVQTVQQLHQLVKQQQQHQQQQPGVSIQQIIHTSQPTIIATVTQSQPNAQMVTKVLGAATSHTPTSQIQAISTGTSISVPRVTSQQHVATLNIANPSIQATAGLLKPVTVTTVPTESVAQSTVQVHPITTVSQQPKLTALSHTVTQSPQQISSTGTAQVLHRAPSGVSVTPTQLHTSLVGQSVAAPLVATIQKTPISSTLAPASTSLQTHTVSSNTAVTQLVVTAPTQTPVQIQTQTKILSQTPHQSSQVFTTQSISTPPHSQTTQIQLTSPVATVAQAQGQSQAKTAPYAMRTRNQPKHT